MADIIDKKEQEIYHHDGFNNSEVNQLDYTSSAPLVSAFADLSTAQTIRKFWRLFIIGFSVSVSGMYLGFTLTIPGSIVGNQGFIDVFGTVRDPVTGALSLDSTYVSIWAGTNFAIQVIFQCISPLTADRFGLKPNMFAFTLLMVIAIVLEIISKDWKVYLVSKIFCGMAAGFIGTSIMTYISEITIPQMRGAHLSAFAFFFAVGQLVAAVGLEILQQTAPLAFRNAFYSEFALLGVWLPILIFLPESPFFLCKKGRADAAKKSLRRLIGNVEGYDVDHEYAVIEQEVAESLVLMEKSSKLGWIACFKGTNLRRTLVSTIPFSMQNFVGGAIMFGYTVYFFQLSGLDNPFQANLIIFCVLIGGVLSSFYLVDKVGRRPLLLIGGVVMGLCDLAIGGIGSAGVSPKSGAGLVVVCAIWVFAYATSVAPIGWLSIVELSTPMLRAKTAGIAAVLQSLSGVIFTYTVPYMLSDQHAGWGAKTGYFFGILALLFTVLVYFTVPETKGRTYAELDELFERRLSARQFRKAQTSVQTEAEKRQA